MKPMEEQREMNKPPLYMWLIWWLLVSLLVVLIVCIMSPAHAAAASEKVGALKTGEHKPGDTWLKDNDGCNTCIMERDKTIRCTAMYCYDSSTVNETSCELKMKEAMKLIRPYIDYGEVGTTTDLLYRSPQTKLREEADRMDRRDAAVRKWEAIYQECVK